MKRIELIMGRNIPDGGRVSDYMINEFIRDEIMPHFEYGTFIDGEGLWKGEYEKTKIFYIEVLILKQLLQRYYSDMLLTDTGNSLGRNQC